MKEQMLVWGTFAALLPLNSTSMLKTKGKVSYRSEACSRNVQICEQPNRGISKASVVI